ncbi:MAG TPA: maleylpyruvate isomerase N-terminal domain-containing protein [Sporichthya sp.]|nr:maleylpyruvate isomerase N-terminal domain-containing protein [Sporichthya sp.]
MESDEARAYLSAADAFADLVGRIDPATLAAPGLGQWDLRALIGHTSRALITVLTYLDQPAAAEDVVSPEAYYVLAAQASVDAAAITERGRQAGAQLGDDPPAAVRDLVDRVRNKVAAVDPEAVITTILGGMRVRAYLPTRTFELVVHCLDIASATGLGLDLPPEALLDAAQLAARICVGTGQAPTLLVALTGRSALPAGFSIVP